MRKKVDLILTGDFGGTRTNLGLFSREAGLSRPLFESTFSSAAYPGLEAMILEFGASLPHGLGIEHACFAVPGPVVDGHADITNLPWSLNEEKLTSSLGITSVRLVNDLVALASALPHLGSEDLYVLNEGVSKKEGALAVIAPGTGLGEAFLTWGKTSYRPHPSEGGHADFAPTDDFQESMLDYLKKKHDHVSYERFCSALGVMNIYNYLKDEGIADEPDWLSAKIDKADDPSKVIVEEGLKDVDPSAICRQTLEIFASILGAESGNMALKVLSTGGVYLGGRMSYQILPFIENHFFLKAFNNKGRLSSLLKQMPVSVVVNRKAGLTGAAVYGLSHL